jgi:CDP-paratose 2-epimerase
MKRVLVTGGAGFVGSSIALALKERYENLNVVVLDNLLRRGSERNLPRLAQKGIEFKHGDVRIKADLEAVGSFDFLFECSAEPSVLAGSDGNPDYVINTNLYGAVNCAEVCRQNNAGMIFLSTSRVYSVKSLCDADIKESKTRFEFTDNQQEEGIDSSGISENFSVNGFKSFYGASKYSAEVMLEEYRELFDFPIIINRCGLLSGPWQFGKADQGIIPFWIKSFIDRKQLKYIGFNGKGKQVRDVLHINDLLNLVFMQMDKPEQFNEGVFNAGGGVESSFSLMELSEVCREVTGNKMEVGSEPKMRYADIPVYITNNNKIQSICDWKIKFNVEEVVMDVYNWLQDYMND